MSGRGCNKRDSYLSEVLLPVVVVLAIAAVVVWGIGIEKREINNIYMMSVKILSAKCVDDFIDNLFTREAPIVCIAAKREP
jgi:hypothetical protein